MMGNYLLFLGVFLVFGANPAIGKGLRSGHTFFILQDLLDGLCLLASSTAPFDVAIDGNSAATAPVDVAIDGSSAVGTQRDNYSFGRYRA